MAEEKARIQRVLAELYDAEETVRPREIAEKMGETSLNVGKDLHRLKERNLAEPAGEGQWRITPEGRECIEGGVEGERGEREGEKEKGRETSETIPSQSDLFRSIGEKLGVGSRKGDIRLDAIIYYLQRTADLDKLTSVWNALTEMAVASDVKKRWIKIYAQNLPGREIPEELREKLEGGEPEKIKADGEGIPPKPKRFSVVGGEILGDSEGDYSFKEALQYVAQQKGASPDDAGSMALELSKAGPEMLTSILSAVTPLIEKKPQQGGEADLLSKLDSLGLLRKSGEEGRGTQVEMLAQLNQLGLLKKSGEGEGSETIKALEIQIKELKDSLQRQEMDTVRNAVLSLANQVSEMRKEMSTQGRLEGRYALMEKTITTIDNQLSGIRSDARPVLDGLAHRGGGPGLIMRSPGDKARKAKGLKEAIELEKEAHALEDELVFNVKQN